MQWLEKRSRLGNIDRKRQARKGAKAACRAALWLSATGCLLELGASEAAAQNTSAHAVTMSAWFNDGTGGGGTSVPFSDADADAMFAEANTIVRTSDRVGDFACDHTLSRQGSVQGLHGNMSDGDITSLDELAYIMDAATFAKIVPRIRICKDMVPGIAGCTPTGRFNTIVIAEWAAHGSMRGLTAAHEYGHAVNLPEEEFQLFNFMIPQGDPQNTSVNETQCYALRTDSLDADGPDGNPASLQTAVSSGATLRFDGDPPSIERLAHSLFFQRAPIEVEDYYGAQDVQTLLRMLGDDAEWDFHPTIALLIGLLAGVNADEVAAGLDDYVQRHPDAPGAHVAVSTLGYLAERGSNLALNLLIDYATQPSSGYMASAVVGLGLSARAEARELLSSLRSNAIAPSGNSAAALGDAEQAEASVYRLAAPGQLERASVDIALAVNQEIATVGRRSYYEQ